MKLIQIAVWLCFVQTIYSQEHKVPVCGTEYLEEIKQEMLRNREEFKNFQFQRGAINYIPVKVFMVALNDGTGAVSPINALRMICQLNIAYKDIELQFYIKELKQLNNTTIAESPRSQGGALQIQLNKDKTAVNIFITHKILDGVAGYYSGPAGSSSDFIVIQKEYIADVRVAVHEVGHYLSLPHTFHGWDSEAWDPAKHGNPVAKFAPDGITINEYADSSNCGPKNVGDGFCDTPADYNFGANSCSYSLQVMDPIGKLVKPQTNNFMNYFFGCSNYVFTPQQKDAVLASFNSTNRRDIRGSSPPVTTTITETTKLISPANGAPTVSADTVSLSWEAVPGATSYLVQYDAVPTFELFVQNFITKETKLKISNLVLNRTYHWRVIPFNDYSTCFANPTRFTFKAGALTAVKDLPQVKSLSLFPNPIQNKQQLNLVLDCYSPFLGDLSIYDLTGKQVIQFASERFTSGLNNKSLNISELKPGIYSLVLQGQQGLASRKLLIL